MIAAAVCGGLLIHNRRKEKLRSVRRDEELRKILKNRRSRNA